jgi:hypothetical protein
MTESHLDRHKDSAEDQERAQDEIESALGERDSVWPIWRAGFGTAQDIRPLRKRIVKSNA